MLRVLHLLGRQASWSQAQTAAAIRAAASSGAARFNTAMLGEGAIPASATSAGRTLRGQHFDVIHAWGDDALLPAAIAARSQMVFTPSPRLRRDNTRRLRRLMPWRPMCVAVPTVDDRTALAVRGISAEYVAVIPSGSLPPDAMPKSAAREKLGLFPIDRVILAVNDGNASGDLKRCVWIAAILHTLDPRYRCLPWGEKGHVGSAASLGRRLNPDCIVAASRPLEDCLAAADVLLIASERPPARPLIAAASAVGVPIVASPSAARGWPADVRPPLVAGGSEPRELARRVAATCEAGEMPPGNDAPDFAAITAGAHLQLYRRLAYRWRATPLMPEA